MSTIFMIGMFIGSYFWGYMGDKKGRIWSFRRTVAVSALSAVGVTASVNYLMLCCFLFVLGFGIGGEITVGGTYANEYLPPSKAWVYTLMCSTWCLGGIISALIALLIVLLGTGPMALWRSVSLVSCILEAIFWVSRLWTKETPKYLYVKGRKEECN